MSSKPTMKAAAELLGTFMFLSVIMASGNPGNPSVPVSVAMGLLAAILVVNKYSGAHLNPAVTVMQWLNGAVDRDTALWYVVAQVAGGVLALNVFKWLNGQNMVMALPSN